MYKILEKINKANIDKEAILTEMGENYGKKVDLFFLTNNKIGRAHV